MLYQPVQGLDHVVRVELSLLGSFAQIKEPLFILRFHREENIRGALERRMQRYRSRFKKISWLYVNLPHLGTVIEYSKRAYRLLPRWHEKLFYGAVAVAIGNLRYGKVILKDLARLLTAPLRRRTAG